MALNFPSSPNVGDKYRSYSWDGTKWTMAILQNSGISFVSDADPAMDGVAAIGVIEEYARGDHVHPTDVSRAAYDSHLMGVVTAANINTDTLSAAKIASATGTMATLTGTATATLGNATATNMTVASDVSTGAAVFTILNVTSAGGGIKLGSGVASSPFIDFHSSGTAIDFDARITASGGSSSDGQGTLDFRNCGAVHVPVPASNDNSSKLATTSYVIANAPQGSFLPLTGGYVYGGVNVINGDLRTYRSDATGVIFLNSAGSAYLYYNGSSYNFNGGHVFTANGRLWGGNDWGWPIYDGRLAYIGDWQTGWQAGMGEPWGGAVFTGKGTWGNYTQYGPTFRGRAKQVVTSSWWTIGYA